MDGSAVMNTRDRLFRKKASLAFVVAAILATPSRPLLAQDRTARAAETADQSASQSGLLAVFLQHTDGKSENQRLLCLAKGRTDGDECN